MTDDIQVSNAKSKHKFIVTSEAIKILINRTLEFISPCIRSRELVLLEHVSAAVHKTGSLLVPRSCLC